MDKTPNFTSHFNRTIHLLDRNGFIRDWLMTDAWISPANDLGKILSEKGNPFNEGGRWVLTNGPDIAPLKEQLFNARPFYQNQEMPELLEGGKVEWRAPGTGKQDVGVWRRVHTGSDGYVDWSHFSYTPEYRHSLMGAQIEIDQPEWRKLSVESQGPVQVWVNGKNVLSTSKFGYMQPLVNEVDLLLPSGISTILISQWQISLREVRHAVRVRINGLPVRVVIPSQNADEYASEIAERALSQLSIKQWAREKDVVEVSGPADLRLRVREKNSPSEGLPIQLKKGKATISVKEIREFAAMSNKERSSSIDGDVTATMLDTGEVFLEFRVDSPHTPVTRILRSAQVPTKVRMYVSKIERAKWKQEVIDHVANSYPSSARALSRLEQNPNYVVTNEDLAPALAMINSRADCADFEAVGLVHVFHRFPRGQWESGLYEKTKSSLLSFKYWIDQPGLDAMCYFTENHQLVWHTAEHLIGNLFASEKFTNAKFAGSEHSKHGADMALEWLKRKLEGGFSEFDSNAYLAIDTLALVSLLEFSPSQQIRSYSEALLDKMLLSLATNSWRGIHGAAHGRSYTTTFRSSRFEETAPIMWALWGMGSLNLAVLPVTTLITAKRYELPELIVKVAHALSKPWNARQVYRGKYRFTSDLLERPYGSDLRVWRTKFGMLSSVQDYRSGLPGLQEHVWGATLSTEVQVFASYPAAHSHATSVRPNAWAGHLVLPRVRQHENVVLAMYPINKSLYPNYTHLWFPIPLMDEYKTKGSWLVGRVKDGYIAVATPNGFSPNRYGDTSLQEWFPNGDGSLYVSVLGDKATHGSFANFLKSLNEPNFDENSLAINFKLGNSYELTWDGLFKVNGFSDQIQNGLPEIPHRLNNPAVRFTAFDERLEASFGGERLTLDTVKGLRIYPKSRAN